MKGLIHFVLFSSFISLLACSSTTTKTERTLFTKADSVTETYLTLQDTLHHAWNLLVNDENMKIKNINTLLDHLLSWGAFEKTTLTTLDNRLDQLRKIRITQKTLGNPYVVEEYDFASNTLISELISLTESKPDLLRDKTIQNLLDQIKIAEQNVSVYRANYDSVAEVFNRFLSKNESLLKEIDRKVNLEKRPLFKAASEN